MTALGRGALITLLACAACDHPVPWAPRALAPNPPPVGNPRRLTFNPEGDWWPAWLPDGSAIGYSYHPLERRDRDRCLAFLPPDGGRILREICERGGAEADSVNVVSAFGASAGGRLAVMADAGNPNHIVPDSRGLFVGRLAGGPLVLARDFPYLTPSGQIHLSATDIVWPNESTLVYLALFVSYTPQILNIPADTEYSGIEMVQLRLRGDSVTSLTVLSGTAGASSVSAGPPDTVYFTLGGDSRVYRLATASGQISTLYDFGALGIARDAQVAGGRLVAVVGGRVHWYFRPAWDIQVQADSGGSVLAVQLPAGAPATIVAMDSVKDVGRPSYRHLALDPSGREVVVEVSPMIRRSLRNTIDTVVSKESDLWLYDVP